MRVLVTGASGFVGYVVASSLVERGHDVSGFVRPSSTSTLPVDVARVDGDIEDREALSDALGGVDAVCHLAARTRVRESRTDPLTYWRANVGGTLALLDAMLTVGTTRLVVASTCAVYGEPPEQPFSEATPEIPSNPYGASKLAADRAVADVAATGALGAVVLRPCNVAGAAYGRTDDDTTRLIPKVLAVQQGRSDELVINGDGGAVRDFVHVADFADAFCLGLESCESGTTSVYTLGSGRRTSVMDAVHAAGEATGAPVRRRHAPAAPEPRDMRADSSLINTSLGWSPQRSSLGEIIRDAWATLTSE